MFQLANTFGRGLPFEEKDWNENEKEQENNDSKFGGSLGAFWTVRQVAAVEWGDGAIRTEPVLGTDRGSRRVIRTVESTRTPNGLSSILGTVEARSARCRAARTNTKVSVSRAGITELANAFY